MSIQLAYHLDRLIEWAGQTYCGRRTNTKAGRNYNDKKHQHETFWLRVRLKVLTHWRIIRANYSPGFFKPIEVNESLHISGECANSRKCSLFRLFFIRPCSEFFFIRRRILLCPHPLLLPRPIKIHVEPSDATSKHLPQSGVYCTDSPWRLRGS